MYSNITLHLFKLNEWLLKTLSNGKLIRDIVKGKGNFGQESKMGVEK